MGAYNVLNRTSLATGQPEDISAVVANFDAIATILNGGIDNSNINAAAAIAASKLAGYPTDGTVVLKGDGTWGRKTTIGTFAAGPPASPSNGDIWIATTVDANGTRWQFQYNAGSASAYKWEFIGGAAALSNVAGQTLCSSEYPAYSDGSIAGPSLVVARGGDYSVEFMAGVGSDVNNHAGLLNPRSTTVAQDDASLAYSYVPTVGQTFMVTGKATIRGVAAGDTIKLQYSRIGGSGNASFDRRRIYVTPVRVA